MQLHFYNRKGKTLRKKIFIITSIVIGVVAGFLIFAYFYFLRPAAYWHMCLGNLVRLNETVIKYAVEHDGVMPESWKAVVDAGYLEAEGWSYWKCPFDKHLKGKPSYYNTSYSALFGRDMKVEIIPLDLNLVFHQVKNVRCPELEDWNPDAAGRIVNGVLEKILTGDSDIKNAIKMLSSKDAYTRRKAIETLRKLGADDYGYAPEKGTEENQKAIQKLEEWAKQYVKQQKTEAE
jgi:hypothetical protein